MKGTSDADECAEKMRKTWWSSKYKSMSSKWLHIYSFLCRKNENVETEFNTFLLTVERLDTLFKALYQIHYFTVVNG